MARIFFVLLVFFGCNGLFGAGAGVTYGFSSGRFGDNLLAYLHAQWIAYHHKITLVYKPFPYSDQLVLDDLEDHYDQVAPYYSATVTLRKGSDRIIPRIPFLYVCPYFPEVQWELDNRSYYSFPVNWTDPDFRKIVRKMIAPKKELSLCSLPRNTINVAIHIREGGGYDEENFSFNDPLKAPPLAFYIDSLKKVLPFFKGVKIYCHIFTDALDPQSLLEKIQSEMLPGAPITFNCRQENNRHNANVLEDFFSLLRFDVLIRPESNFSIVAELINEYLIVCSPASFSKSGKEIAIDRIKVKIRGKEER